MANTENAKMTRREALENAIKWIGEAVEGDKVEETVQVLTNMLAQVNKQAAKAGGKTDARKANEELAKAIYKIAPAEPFTGDFVSEHSTALTPQKVTAVMAVGEELGLFTRTKIGKRVAYQKIG